MKLPKPAEQGSARGSAASEPKKPKSLLDTVVTSTPVVMTVLATILAGLSSSEMSQSQYYMARSAKEQSKAGDQWSFFQAKKGRSSSYLASLETLRNTGEVAPFTEESFLGAAKQAEALLASAGGAPSSTAPAATRGAGVGRIVDDPDVREAMKCLGGELPPLPDLKIADAEVRRAVEAVRKAPDEDNDVYGAVRESALQEATRAASEHAVAADDAMRPAEAGVAKLQAVLDSMASAAADHNRRATTTRAAEAPRPATTPGPGAMGQAGGNVRSASDRGAPADLRLLAGDFAAARMRFESARQEREARVNQQTAYLYEVAVRKTAWESERHRMRSRSFFFGMLAAQAAVTIASIALAVKERSWLWSLAATIGVLALLSAGYVYVFM